MRNRCCFLSLVFACSLTASAQTVLVAVEEDGDKLVKACARGTPQVEENGRLRRSSARSFYLRSSPVYAAGFLQVDDLRFDLNYTSDADGGGQFNATVNLFCRMKSEEPLENCFLVIEFMWDGKRTFMMYELPDLAANRERKFGRELSLGHNISVDTYRYIVHFYTNGLELLNSTMGLPAAVLETRQRLSEEFRTRNKPDQGPVPVRPVRPSYPAALMERRVSGSARILCQVDENGAVTGTEVEACTDPLFGGAAEDAVRQWRFQPALKDYQFVPSAVVIPFDFEPPDADDSASAAE